MYFQKRGERYSFIYYIPETKRNARLPRNDTPDIKTDQEAQAFCQQWNEKHRTTDILVEEKLAWTKKYPEFLALAEIYENNRKEEAENSWETYGYYIKYYVFTYFLGELNQPSIHKWDLHFEDFRDYLQTVSRIKGTSSDPHSLAYATMNAIIKALNGFLLVMFQRNHLRRLRKCRFFPKRKLRVKSEESVIPTPIGYDLYHHMKKKSPLAADMFLVGLHTGMRKNELMGLSLADLSSGPPQDEVLKKILIAHPSKVYGFISLDSQPVIDGNPRDRDGRVPRKPLKGKDTIEGRNSLTIPIFNLRCFNILVDRWNEQRLLFEQHTYGEDPKDYLLFNGLRGPQYYRYVITAQKELLGEKRFTPHDTRHTYSTWLAESTGGDFGICKMTLGHSREETTQRYVHMGARIHRKLKSQIQLKMPMTHAEEKSNTIPLFPRGIKSGG